MMDAIDKTLGILRTFSDPYEGWNQIVDVCISEEPGVPWASLPILNINAEIKTAKEWVIENLDPQSSELGIYLGLDTLNMKNGEGKNILIGFLTDPKIDYSTEQWVYDSNIDYGTDFLLKGLYELKRIYSLPEWRSVSRLCDYVFFLGYSGIVLTRVFEQLESKQRLHPVWGFHDGDMFTLGHLEHGIFKRAIGYAST